MRTSRIGVVVALFFLLSSTQALAQALPNATSPTAQQERAQRTAVDDDWPYHRYDWLDGAVTLVGGAVAFGATFVWPSSGTVRWNGGILFDDAVRDALRAESRTGREQARAIGDVFYITGALYPSVIDGLALAAIRRQPKRAAHMLLVNAEAYAVAGGFLIGTERLYGRARPSVEPCEGDPGYEAFCGERDRAASMISGHTGIVATSAGLLCVHHQHLRIYQDPIADAAACVLGIGFAAGTGLARIVNDRHYATDVLAGFVVGAGAGYVLPLFRFYRTRRIEGRPARAVTVLPMVSPSIAGMAAIGSF